MEPQITLINKIRYMDNNVTTPDIMDTLIPQAPRRETVSIPDTRDQRIAYANKLHTERTELEGQIQQAERRQWMIGVVLGYTLAQIKQDCTHGEWLRLFKGGKGNSAHVRNLEGDSNSKHAWNFNFSDETARTYRQLYEGVAKKCRKLGGDRENEMTRMLQEPGEQLYLALGELSDATSIRAARADLCDDDKPRYDAERRTANLLAHRNEAGRPSKEEIADPAAEAAAIRAANDEHLEHLCGELHRFHALGRYLYLSPAVARSAIGTLARVLEDMQGSDYQ